MAILGKNQLKYLGIVDTGISFTGKHLLSFLTCKKWKIESLCLNGNNIGYDGAKLLSDGLSKHVKIIDLSRNQLGAKGCIALSKAIINVISLDLSYNMIHNEGAKALANALEIKGSQIRELRVQGNSISQDGMIEVFKSKNMLKILDLSENIT